MRLRLLCAAALLFAACSKCGKETPAGATGVERLLPRGSLAVVVVPDVRALGERLKGLESLKVGLRYVQPSVYEK